MQMAEKFFFYKKGLSTVSMGKLLPLKKGGWEGFYKKEYK